MLVCVLNALLNIKNKLSDILFGPLIGTLVAGNNQIEL